MGDKISFVEMRRLKEQSFQKQAAQTSGASPSPATHLITPPVENAPLPQHSPASKRAKLAESSHTEISIATEKNMSSKPPPEKRVTKRKWFDITHNALSPSCWNVDFNPRHHLDEHLTFQTDIDAAEKYGPSSTYEAAATYALRTVELVRLAEKERAQMHYKMEQVNRDLLKMKEMHKELEDFKKEREHFAQKNEELQKK